MTALEDVNLEIGKGDIYGIIGMSGAGKSTLLRCLTLLERPTSGQIMLAGQDIASLSGAQLRAARRGMGVVFQGYNLLMQKTVAENVAFPLRLEKGYDKAAVQARVAELLAIVGLEDRAGAYPAQLSGGQKQRVAIARALATQPEMLLCDEPTSALDPLTTKSMLALLTDINKKLGVTIIIITHELSVVQAICSLVAVISEGRLAESGAVVLVLNRHILRLVFGNVEPDVMQAAETYFWLSALSYPMLALYNAGAALFRSMGNSRISLFASLIMNVINIGGNALLIYGLNWGVAGAATATLASRTVAGLMMMLLLRNRDNPIFLERLFHPEWNGGILKSILRVGVPNGLENGMFQIGKLLVAGLITTFGTSAIAANAICNNVGSMSNIPGSAIGLAMITVVGQCVGAKDYQQARHYTKTLLAAAYVSMGLLNIALFLLAPYLVGFYAMPQTTTDLALSVLQVNCVVTVLIWPSSFTLPNALRAAGDARFTMVTSMVSMWVFRIGMSYVLGAWLGMGLFGVWTAMQIDWAVRSLVFGVRFLGHKWEKARVLEG